MKAFDALGDPVRRQILERLSLGEQAAGDVVAFLQAQTSISQPAVSQHLKVLREAGLVTVRPAGSRRLYALAPAALEAAREWLAALIADPLAALAQPLDALETEVARGRRERSASTPEPQTGSQTA